MHIAGGFPDLLIDHIPRLGQALKFRQHNWENPPGLTFRLPLYPLEVKFYLVE